MTQPAHPADHALAGLDVPELAAQLCWITVHGARADAAHPANRSRLGVDRPADAVAELAPGGIVLFAWSGNCEHPQQVATLLGDLQTVATQSASGLPLGVAIDEEGGRVTRIGPPATAWPSARALARAAEPEEARGRWRAGAVELASLGISVNLAPVADVATQGSPVLGERVFSTDPGVVGAHAAAAVAGLHDGGVAAVAKHFPGHGATAADSHVGLPRVPLSRAELETSHLAPFRHLFAHQPPAGVMPAHLMVEALDDTRPATLSPSTLNEVLRGELGFAGAIVSDSLAMGALAGWEPGAVAVAAIAAGVDVLLCPPDPRAAVAALVDAVQQGQLSAERLADAARRGAALKAPGPALASRKLSTDLGRHRLATDLAARALAVVDDGERLPLRAAPLVVGARGAATLTAVLRRRGLPARLLELAAPDVGAPRLADANQRLEPAARVDGAEHDSRRLPLVDADAAVRLAGGGPLVVVVDSEADGAARDLWQLTRHAATVVIDVGCGEGDVADEADAARIVAYGADELAMEAVGERLLAS